MLWFGLRARLGKLTRALRVLQDRLERLERVADPVALRSVTLQATAALDAAQNKLNSVVERRRKQLAAAESSDSDDDTGDDLDDQIRELMGQRRGVTLPDPDDDDPEGGDDEVPTDGR